MIASPEFPWSIVRPKFLQNKVRMTDYNVCSCSRFRFCQVYPDEHAVSCNLLRTKHYLLNINNQQQFAGKVLPAKFAAKFASKVHSMRMLTSLRQKTSAQFCVPSVSFSIKERKHKDFTTFTRHYCPKPRNKYVSMLERSIIASYF